MPQDAVESFETVVLIGNSPLGPAVNASTPYRTLQDVLAAACAKPGHRACKGPLADRCRLTQVSTPAAAARRL